MNTSPAFGSRCNAALIQAAGAGLLIDLGLAPRLLGKRLMSVDSACERIGCALLTARHADGYFLCAVPPALITASTSSSRMMRYSSPSSFTSWLVYLPNRI